MDAFLCAIMKNIEYAYWYDWRKKTENIPKDVRLYYGHETCEHLLPHQHTASEFAKYISDHRSSKLCLVTPFLTDAGIQKALKLIDCLLTVLYELEVICSDWGLLYYLSRHKIGTPVVGRLLAGQISDPRILRIVDDNHTPEPRKIRHVNGHHCVLKRKMPSNALKQHYKSCSIDKHETISFLTDSGIHRCELNNVAQGIELNLSGYTYSLHVPEVLVSVMRRCPGDGENLNQEAVCPCPGINSNQKIVWWCHHDLPVDLFRHDNALYYQWPELPANLDRLPIDRIVFNAENIGS